ncbi:MAG TPA: glycosyltransferase family 39 protein, partial [Anaerolineae bacterium]
GLLLTGVLLLGILVYYHDLDGVPAELDSPHAEKILDVNLVLNGARPIYVERGLGHPPLDYFLTAVFVTLTKHPLDFMALKLVDAALGVSLVLGTFLLARELFEFDVALAAAALVAIGKWPLALARDGMAYPFAPLALVVTLYFLVRALKFQQRNDFLMTGLFLGLGFYGSDVVRFAPVLIAVFLICAYLAAERNRRPPLGLYLRNSVLLFGLALIVALPLVRYALDRPAIFWNETLARLFGEGRPVGGDLPASLGTFVTNLWHAVLMFNWKGDGGWPVNVPGDPMLDYITGALFLFGLMYALFHVLRHREFVYALTLLGLALILFPSAISLANPDENPSAVFASGAIPFVFILAAFPLVWLGRVIERMVANVMWSRTIAVGLVLILFGLAARANFNRYFSDFAGVYRQASWNSSEIASAIRGFAGSVGDANHAWIVAYPDWVDARNVGINMGQIGWQQALENADAALSQVGDGEIKLFVLSAADSDNLVRLQEIFPNGQIRAYHALTPGHDWLLFIAPGNATPGDFGFP